MHQHDCFAQRHGLLDLFALPGTEAVAGRFAGQRTVGGAVALEARAHLQQPAAPPH